MKRARIELGLDEFKFKPVTVSMLRDAVFGRRIFSGPGFIEEYMPRETEINTLNDMARYAVDRGQVIDFGYWPNSFIQETAKRVGRLYTQGALPMPFTTPWIFLHSWRDERKEAELLKEFRLTEKELLDVQTSAYLIHPMPGEKGQHCIDFEGCCLEGFQIKGLDFLGVGDRVFFDAEKSHQSDDEYYVQCVPMQWRFGDVLNGYPGMEKVYGWTDPEQAAVGNICDPLVTALALLNTRGIEQETISVSERLNKARAKNRKPPIPPYRKVNSATYIAALRHHDRQRGEPTGDKRASPAMHIRIGHWRNYKKGTRTFILDTLVKADENAKEAFKSTRTHYKGKTTENT
jgi:hypothetical protein